jgi:hypothetical protein
MLLSYKKICSPFSKESFAEGDEGFANTASIST